MTGQKQPPPTMTENRVLERTGLYLVTVQKEGMRAMRLQPGRALTVGRAPESDVCIESTLLSRTHFAILAASGDVPAMVEDRGSSNGTRLNGKLVPAGVRTPVEVGSLIEAGGIFFVLRDHVPPDALPASDGAIRAATPNPHPIAGVVVVDAAMQRLHELVELVARSNISVLITGETGVGKEVISASVHARSPRVDKPFVSLNCAALPETLLESELFGYERGAFTGATNPKQGLIESAHEGTLFLDEIGEMPLATQAKLLRVLENGEITRIGALKPRVVDVRFIAATNRDPSSLVSRGEFRRDLYFRLNGITIPVPPLRERTAEIAQLAQHFLSVGARRVHRRVPHLAPDVLPILVAHTWPGNIRELRNVMDRALALCATDVVRAQHVILDPPMRESPGEMPQHVLTPQPAMSSAPPPVGGDKGRLLRLDADTERRMIEGALERAGGNQGRAAELLGISRRTLINRLDEYAIKRPRKRSDSTS